MHPKQRKLLALRFSALCALSLFCICPAKTKAPDSGWIVEQDSPNTGDCTLYITQNAVKIFSKRFGFVLICKGPDWRVHGFRTKEKLIWSNTLSQFDGSLLVRPLSTGTLNDDKVEPTTVEMKNGVRCRLYINRPFNSEKVWVAEDIAIAAKGAEFLQRFYEAPATSKVPITRCRFLGGRIVKKNRWMADYQYTDKPKWRTLMDTSSCKKATFPAGTFDVPTGYKATQGLTQVTFSTGKMSDLTDALNSLGFREDKSKK